MRHAFVTACNAAFLPGAAATLASCRRHHPHVARYCFVPAADLAVARQTLGELAEVLPPPRALAGVPPELQMCAVRVFMVTLPADVVVYVDSDAFFCAPAPELWAVQGDAVLGVPSGDRQVVLTGMPAESHARFRELYPVACQQRPVNTGVLALRPAAWADLPAQFEAMLTLGQYPRYTAPMDQPLLSVLFGPRLQWHSRAFNASDLYDLAIPPDVRIVHFTGPAKPWMPHYPKHVPMYAYWVRHGLGEVRWWPLLVTHARIAFWYPRFALSQALRQRREQRERRNQVAP